MKKTFRITSLVTVLALLVSLLAVGFTAAASATYGAGDVIYDGAAEQTLDGYRLWLWNDDEGRSGVSATVDTATTYNGKSTLKLSATLRSVADVNVENIQGTIPAGSTIKMSMNVKTDNVESNGQEIYFQMSGTGFKITVPHGTNDWTYVEQEFTVTEDIVDPKFFYGCQWFTGDIWFQGAKVEVVSVPGGGDEGGEGGGGVTPDNPDTPDEPSDPNILYDGQAESSLDGYRDWSVHEDDLEKRGTISVDTEVTRDGKSSLKIQTKDTSTLHALLIEDLPASLPAGTTLKLSGWVKTENLQTTAYGARLVLKVNNQEYESVSGPLGTADWTYIEKTFTLSEEISNLLLCIKVTWATGTAWFQGVRFEILPNPNILYDGQAESNMDGYRTWTVHDGDPAKQPSISIDTEVTHNGKSSLKIQTKEEATIQDLYIENLDGVTLPAGTAVKLSGWIKSENVQGHGEGVRLVMNANGKEYGVYGPKGTADWTYVEKTFILPEETTKPTFYYNLHWATGTVWFQGFRAEVVVASDVLYDGEAEKNPNLGGYPSWKWGATDDGSTDATISQDTEITLEGAPSIRFEAATSSIADLYVPLNYTLKAGKAVKISAYIKTEGLESTGAGMRIVLQSDDGKELLVLGQLIGDNNWTYVEKEFTAEEDTLLKQVFMNYQWSTGKAWVQGLKVEVVDPSTEDSGDLPWLPPEDDEDDEDIFGPTNPGNDDNHPSGGEGAGDNTGNDSENNTGSEDNGSDDNGESPVTGVTSAVVPALLLMLVAAAVAVLSRKRIA